MSEKSASENGSPLISVVTVCFNSEQTIEKTICSVLSQSFKELQYVIVDGLSSDRTIEIIKKYAAQDSRLRWVSEKDQGIYDAMNKGTKLSHGQFIHYLNSDDCLIHNDVYLQAAAYLKDPRALYYGQIRYLHSDGKTSILGYPFLKNDIKYELKGIHQPAAFFPRQKFDKIGFFEIQYRYSADYDLIRRFYKSGPSQFVPLQVTEMADGGASKDNFEKALAENTEIAKKFGDASFMLLAIKQKAQIGKWLRYKTPFLFHLLRKWILRKKYF